MEAIRKFALIAIDDYGNEVDRYPLDYVESPRNLGFELEFKTLNTQLTTQFTDIKEKKLSTNFNINFLPPNAYAKAVGFRNFVQKYLMTRTLIEYNNTEMTQYWEGKVQKFGQEELQDWGGLTCPVVFMPSTPKFINKEDSLAIHLDSSKIYSYSYPYTYGRTEINNTLIDNTYMGDIPLKITIYGRVRNPAIGLTTLDENGEQVVYARLSFTGLLIEEGEHLIIDSTTSKISLWRGGKYVSAYDYIYRGESNSTFLYAKGNTQSHIVAQMSPDDTGSIIAGYRQYIL